MVTFRVTVFEIALPFFGFTVTVTLQEPAFNPLSVIPDTLQNLAELATTFSDTFEVDNTLSFANAAIDLAETVFLVVIAGAVTLGVVTVGVAIVGVVTVGVVNPATARVCQLVQFPALSLTRISTDVATDFCSPLDETENDKSVKGTETLVA